MKNKIKCNNNGTSKKKFRPCKIPRYLIGSVKKNIWMTDLQEYNNHRYRIFTARCRVDTKPPKMNPFLYVDRRRLATDAARLKDIDRDNKELLKKINIIDRTIGRIDSYNPHAYESRSKWFSHIVTMRKIEENNKKVYEKITNANSSYGRDMYNEMWRGIVEKLSLGSKFPLIILQKISQDVLLPRQPSISSGLEQIAQRPLCFLEFSVKDGLFLGRTIIELYHDHVPVTVQNFLTICSGEKGLTYKNCNVHRIVPGRFLETGDITLGTGRGGKSIYGKKFAEEGHKLKHTKAGVLSMVRVGKHNNNSKFSITFGNVEALDKQNVVFGKIIRGNDHLFKIEGYGRKIGKPLAPIIISNCGVF